jgi:penicillin-binding protein 1A
MAQAVWYNIRKDTSDNMRGGSTITQQLVKNVFLTNEKTYERKVKELVLSILIEWNLDKYQILERYFNQIPYGGETYGVQEAANKYFGKNVWELSMSEAAFLAGLPQHQVYRLMGKIMNA